MQRLQRIRGFIDVPKARNSADARRRWLLNILLIGVTLITFLTLVATFLASASGSETQAAPLYIGILVALPVFFGIYLLNRYVSGTLATSLFLALLIWSFSLDLPIEVVKGRSLFLFAIPILMASFLIRPAASFLVGLIIGGVTYFIAVSNNIAPNYVGMISFQTFGLIAWLGARSLEKALSDLETTNRELDQRVVARTAELNQALAREKVEANKLAAILESTADGVVVFDNRDLVSLSNPAAERLLETPDLAGKDIKALAQAVPENFRDALILFTSQRRIPFHGHVLSVTFAPVITGTDDLVGQVAVFRDVTQEAQVETMRDTFIAIASHEMRTPLNGILGYAEMILQKAKDSDLAAILHHAGRMITITKNFSALADNLLDKAQIDTGNFQVRYEQVVPAILIGNVLEDLKPHNQDAKSKIMLEGDLSLAPAEVITDPQRVTQVARNLIQNAFKFTDQGSITLKVFCPSLDKWAISVTDTGRGIPVEAQAYVFDSFRQADSSIAREHRGVGLGLSIIKQIVIRMGGEISLQSQVGVGSTFTVVLPIHPSNDNGNTPDDRSNGKDNSRPPTGSLR